MTGLTLWGLAMVCLAATYYFSSTYQQQQTTGSLVARYIPPLRSVLRQQPAVPLDVQLRQAGFSLGQPVLLRLYKQESELEVWLQNGTKFELFKTYPICKWSGTLGPKLKEGDGQSPEGFYEVSAKQLNPNSRYHLAMNIGFPNAHDAALARTGSALMIHGSCVSVGCFAMTDAGVEEIYTLVDAALLVKQPSVPIHIFPFRMNAKNLQTHSQDAWTAFWHNLAEGDAVFQQTRIPPKVFTCGGRYYFNQSPAKCERVQAW
jgi:murein L,D-transpeptidase YafK